MLQRRQLSSPPNNGSMISLTNHSCHLFGCNDFFLPNQGFEIKIPTELHNFVAVGTTKGLVLMLFKSQKKMDFKFWNPLTMLEILLTRAHSLALPLCTVFLPQLTHISLTHGLLSWTKTHTRTAELSLGG